MIDLNLSSFPILVTERLTLRQLSPDDRQAVYALRSDPEVNMYLNRQPCSTIEDAINFISKVNENIEKRIAFYWAITLSGRNTMVGTICLFDFSSEKSSCEIGYELLPEFQGQGIMKEAAQIVIDYVFQTWGLGNLLAVTHCDNQSSNQLLSKLKFAKTEEKDLENPDLIIFRLTPQQ